VKPIRFVVVDRPLIVTLRLRWASKFWAAFRGTLTSGKALRLATKDDRHMHILRTWVYYGAKNSALGARTLRKGRHLLVWAEKNNDRITRC
jgi:hypothetical protein